MLIKNVPEGSWVIVTSASGGLEVEDGDQGMVIDNPTDANIGMSKALLMDTDDTKSSAIPVPDFTHVDVLSEARMPGIEDVPDVDIRRPLGSRLGQKALRGLESGASFLKRAGQPSEKTYRPQVARQPGRGAGERLRGVYRGGKQFARDVGVIGSSRLDSGLSEFESLSGDVHTLGENVVRGVRRFAGQFSGNQGSIGSMPVGTKVKVLETDERSELFEGDEGIVGSGPRGRTRTIKFRDTGEEIEPRQTLQVRVIARPVGTAQIQQRPGSRRSAVRLGTMSPELEGLFVDVPDRRFRRGVRPQSLSELVARSRSFRPPTQEVEEFEEIESPKFPRRTQPTREVKIRSGGPDDPNVSVKLFGDFQSGL